MVFRFLIAASISACAAAPKAPVAARGPQTAATPHTLEGKCAEASKARAEGYAALNGLRLNAAKKAYMRSLELDPDNRGALYQLDIIEALATDRQVGTSVDNDALYSSTYLSPCQRFEAEKVASQKPHTAETVHHGQIISFAKGNAHERDLLSHQALRATTTTAVSSVLSCYREGLADNPGLHGEVTAKLSVEADGTVSSVELEANTLDEATVERCIERVFSKLQFPRRKGSRVALNVLVPLTLQAPEGMNATANVTGR